MAQLRIIPGTLLLIALTLTSCSKLNPEPPIPLVQAHEKFLQLCQEQEFSTFYVPPAGRAYRRIVPVPRVSTLPPLKEKLSVIFLPLEKTVWIYVPLSENLVNVAATPEGPQKSAAAQKRPTIKYVHSVYENQSFRVSYDIHPDKAYAQTQGTKMAYLPIYQQISQRVMMAISQAYFDAIDPPLFFVVVIADVVNGIEIENTFHREGLKRYMILATLPQEEFVKRSLYEIRGKTEWIGDKEGKHLEPTEITVPEFLARQITSRINFKYQQSSFPPSNDTRAEVLTIVAETLKNYNFTDFNYVELRDLNTGLNETILPAELKAISTPPPTPPMGKIFIPTAAE